MESPDNRHRADDSYRLWMREIAAGRMIAMMVPRSAVASLLTERTSRSRNRRGKSQAGSAHNSSEEYLPDLVMLLAEPEIRLVMSADRVNERELLATLRVVSVQLRKRTRRQEKCDVRQKERQHPISAYRPGVGIVLINNRSEIFVGRRIDTTQDAWQMPQGGINRGEIPRRAALRELKEEIGTDNVRIIAESKRWLYYDVPSELAQKAWRGRWQGQRQKWFLMLLNAPDTNIDVCTEHPEFDTWRRVSLAELSALAVSFKRKLYLDILGEFSTFFRD